MTQIQKGDKLTIVVKNNLSEGYKVVQTSHALANFAIDHSDVFNEWNFKSNYLCCLEISKFKFEILLDKLSLLKIKYSVFFEPDISDTTAVAVEPLSKEQHKKLFKNLKLTT